MRACLTLLCCYLAVSLSAQLNSTLVGQLDYEDTVNDVWGYVAPDGTEYAIVGLNNGVSIVSLADPGEPTEVAYVGGVFSPWRDMKTYGEYAYVTADVGLGGLTIIDLSELPDGVQSTARLYSIPGFEGRSYGRAHNLYIDTTLAQAFLAGGDFDINGGGVIILDLAADPWMPPVLATGPAIYAHDVYVQDSLMYASEIYRGEVAVYDVSDPQRIRPLGRTQTPFEFTHNAWTDDTGTLVFTTDEVANAPVAAYDISDLNDIKFLDTYRPLSSLNTGTIPHNVHVIDEYLSISYYTDGLRVVDASVPDNLVEVANYDTYPGPSGGFSGAWGAYPFLPSGLTLVSDRQRGLFVVDVDYRRAARLSGRLLDAESGSGINEGLVEIIAEQPNIDRSDGRGRFATGLAEGGDYSVRASALGYYADTLTLSIANGATTERDIELTARPLTPVAVELRDRRTEETIGMAHFVLDGRDPDFGTEIDRSLRSDTNGLVSFEAGLYDYAYELYITAWGYRPQRLEVAGNELSEGRIIYLDPGYVDDYLTDLGWQTENAATSGDWERGRPQRSGSADRPAQPDTDVAGDAGELAYITELRGDDDENLFDVDNGSNRLISPPIVLDDSLARSGRLAYQYWFVNRPTVASRVANDTLRVAMTTPMGVTTELAAYTGEVATWTVDTIDIGGLFAAGDTVRLVVTVSDDFNSDDIVEAGFDAFRLLTSFEVLSSVADDPIPVAELSVFPNPSAGSFELAYDLRGGGKAATLSVHSVSGQRVAEYRLSGDRGRLGFGEGLPRGVYLLHLADTSGRRLRTLKAIKH